MTRRGVSRGIIGQIGWIERYSRGVARVARKIPGSRKKRRLWKGSLELGRLSLIWESEHNRGRR